jgi:uncharacterized membrane protein
MPQSLLGGYSLSWVGGLVFFLIYKRSTVIFNAMQSIVLGAAYFIIIIVLTFTDIGLFIVPIFWILFIILLILLMVRTYLETTRDRQYG